MLPKVVLAVPLAAALGLLAIPSVQAHAAPIFVANIPQSDLLVQAKDETADEIDGQPDNSQMDDTVDTSISYDGANNTQPVHAPAQVVYAPEQPPVYQPVFGANGQSDVQENDNNGENDNEVQDDNNGPNGQSNVQVQEGDNSGQDAQNDNGGD